MNKTFSLRKEDVKEVWYIVDATDKVLGRFASEIAYVLRGKHDPKFTPHVNMKYHVIVTNAEKIKLTGKKLRKKVYYFHTGWVGNLKERTLEMMLKKHPERIIKLAVKRMLPKNKLGAKLLKNLKVYAGSDHPHQAQKPQPFPLDEKGKKLIKKENSR